MESLGVKQVGLELRNPFLIYGYASLRYFCDQTDETEKMLSALENGRNIALITFQRIGKTGFIKTCSIICSSVRRKMMLLVFYMDIFATRNLPASVCLLAKTVLGQLDTLSEMVLHKLFFSVLAIRWLVLMSYTYRIFEFCTG